MDNKEFQNISDIIGKGLKIKKQSDKKTKLEKDEELFLDLITKLKNAEIRSMDLERLGVNTVLFEGLFYEIIENLLLELYGEFGASLLMLYCFETSDENKEINLRDNEGKEYTIKTPKQLYKFIKTWKEK